MTKKLVKTSAGLDFSAFQAYIDQIPVGKHVIVDIDVESSKSMNRKLHAWLREIANHTGYQMEEIKDIVKTNFKVESFTLLNRGEFLTLMEDVQRWALHEFQINLM